MCKRRATVEHAVAKIKGTRVGKILSFIQSSPTEMTVFAERLAQALERYNSGQLDAAKILCGQALAAEPTSADAWCLLGSIACEKGSFDEAVQSCGQALQLQPDYVEARYCLGVALRYVGRLDESAESLQRVIHVAPQFAPAHGALGNVLKAQGKITDAIASFRRALELEPNSAEILTNMSLALRDCNFAEALVCAKRAVEIQSDSPQAHNNLAFALLKDGDTERAIEHGQKAIQLDPRYADAHTTLAAAYQYAGRLDEALSCCQQAISLYPSHAEAFSHAGAISVRQGNFDEANRLYNRACEIDPHLATARLNRSTLLLMQGDFERGWPEYESRWETGQVPMRKFAQPRWNGESLTGKTILIWSEQGLGDTIQFIRFASFVKARGATVIVECQKALKKLLATCAGIDQSIAEGDALPSFDFHLPLLSLPGIFKTSVETVPAVVPYLFADPSLVAHWRDRLKDIRGFRIGLNWRGRSEKGPWQQRDVPLALFSPLAQIPGVRLISLQKGEGRRELANVSDRSCVIDLGDEVDTSQGPFMDTAAIMMNLDLIISSDTSVPHLAGSLGVPIWIAVPFSPGWQWLLDRSDSPWYPTMRLFRQKQLGDWGGVFNEILAALEELVRQR